MFRNVLWRIVNSHAFRFVPRSNCAADRNAFRYVSWTRSSASAGRRVSRSAVPYRLSTYDSASRANAVVCAVRRDRRPAGGSAPAAYRTRSASGGERPWRRIRTPSRGEHRRAALYSLYCKFFPTSSGTGGRLALSRKVPACSLFVVRGRGRRRSRRMTRRPARTIAQSAICWRSRARPAGTWLAAAPQASSATLAHAPFRGRDRCGNRLSYSNIGDEQPTI